MEVEVKLRLPDSFSHQKLSDLLSSFHLETLIQENFFFDTSDAVLAFNRAAIRLRFHSLDTLCILSLKANPQISAGISRVEEDEEQIDPFLGRACVSEPWRLPDSSRILRRAKEEYGIAATDLVCLGGFRNLRAVYAWKGLKLEVDETEFAFGRIYEIECESKHPETAKNMIEDLLVKNEIRYSYSNTSKFAFFRSGILQ